MSLTPSRKRTFQYPTDAEAMRPKSGKRARTDVNLQNISANDWQVLQHAARLLNKPVSQLLNDPAGDMFQGQATQNVPSTFVSESQAPISNSALLANPQNWLPTSSSSPAGNDNRSGYSLSQPRPGLTSNAMNNNELENWCSLEMLPNGTSQLVEVQPLPFNSGVSSRAEQTGATREANETHTNESDSSSEVSDLDTNHFDAQPWEDVQIASVDNVIPPTDPSGADFAWIYDVTETPEDMAGYIGAEVSTGSMQLTPARSVLNAPELSQQKSRRSFPNQALRDETSNTRKLKACVRCRMQKIRCIIDENDPKGCCKTCQAVSKQRLYTLPCARYKVTECTLYRTGKAPGLEFTMRWPVMKLKDITKWASDEIREIKVQSDVCNVPLTISARRFVPLPEDSRKRGWMDGKIKKFKETTPYAVVNMTLALKDMKDYIDKNVLACINYFLKASDVLVKETYDFAIRHTERHRNDEEGLLMGNYLRLWFAIRRTHTTEHIVSQDTLDMEPETVDKSFPLFGKVPLPPVMIQQLDMILTLGILQPLRKKVLEDLQRLILSNKPNSWMTVYLITFMSLHNCATISNENYRNARKHGLRRRYAMPAFVQERHHAANVFLSHYHYRTQPCDPFKLDWKRRQATPFADLAPSEIQFLMRTKNLVKQKSEQFQTARDISLYEDELYFVSQMYEDDWQPRESVIDFDDGTINNVPLREYG